MTATPDTAVPIRPTSALATGRGKLILTLLCAAAFLDFVDASIVNVALPSIRSDLGFTVQGLQWVSSGYLLTYGGFMLLGGRSSDLLGRRRLLVAGTVAFAVASLLGGLAGTAEVLVGSRLAQGVGAAMMVPAALSILTTTFSHSRDRHIALGAWGAMAGLASAVGVLAGGVLTEGPGWRWVLFVNPPVCLLLLVATFGLIADDRQPAARRNDLGELGPVDEPGRRSFDLLGAFLVTGGMLVLVHGLVEAPSQGWSSYRTITELAVAVAMLVGFVVNEALVADPLLDLAIFRIRGLAAADVTQLIGVAGFGAMFFFLTLYMQSVLGYSPIKTGLAYLPVAILVGVAAGITSQLLAKLGTRPLIAGGSLLAAAGVFLLSRIPVNGSYVVDVLPGFVLMSIGLGAVFVAVTSAANAGVPARQAGLAAALLNASQQLGAALGLAVFSTIATSRTQHLVAEHADPTSALASGFQRALLFSSLALVAAAVIALRAPNVKGDAGSDDGMPVEALAPPVGVPDLT